MSEWTFIDLGILKLLFFVPILAIVMIAAKSLEFKKISKLGPGAFRHLAFRWSKVRFWLRTFLFVFGYASIVAALAGPRLGFQVRELPHGGRDIMVLFDISRSMNADDISPSRMDRAKRKLLDLIAGLKGERVGIVPFAGRAFVHCPLTDDKSMLTLFVNSLEDSLISVQGTNLTEAVKIASESLEKGAAGDSTGKSLLILTDGEDFSGDILSVRSLISSKKLELSIMGIGTPSGSPIPQKEGGLVKDRGGNLVISKLAETDLMDLAKSVGGLYVRSTAGDADVNALLQKLTEKTHAHDMGEEKVWNEYFQLFLFIGLVAIVLGWFLTPYQALTMTVLLLMSSAGFSSDGFSLFKKKKYDEAALSFEKEASSQDHNFLPLYNAAVAHYEAMNYDAAILGFKRATESQDESLRRDAFFNLANTLVAQNKLEESVKPFKDALGIDGSFKEAKENLEWVLKRLQQKEEQKKQQSGENQDQKSEKNAEKSPNNQNSKNDGQSSNQDPKNSPSSSSDKNSQQAGNNGHSPSDPPNQKANDSQTNQANKPQDQSGGGQSSEEKKAQEDKQAKESGAVKDDHGKSSAGLPPQQAQSLVPGQQVSGAEEAKALLRQVDENMKVWGVKPQFDENPREKDW